MFVIVYCPETDETILSREIGDDEIMDTRAFANEVADMYGVDIDDSGGYIPNCCGDIRVEFRPDIDNHVHIWNGESFYFKREDC